MKTHQINALMLASLLSATFQSPLVLADGEGDPCADHVDPVVCRLTQDREEIDERTIARSRELDPNRSVSTYAGAAYRGNEFQQIVGFQF